MGDVFPSSTTDQRPCCVEIPMLHFGKDICHHSNGNTLHKVEDSAASVVGDTHQTGEGWKRNTNFIIYNVVDG